MKTNYDIIVIGGGHAGIEAAHAAARLGSSTLLLTMDCDAIGRMSCNPAIGGIAKGQLVRDIDALGGLMAVLADESGIQFRMLNQSKGPAVWGPRAQMDMHLYSQRSQFYLKQLSNLSFLSDEVVSLTSDSSSIFNLKTKNQIQLTSLSVIITSGTFLGSVMYTGLSATKGGRIHENSADELSKSIQNLGITTRRLKTGTPSRLAANSIDYSRCQTQKGDEHPHAFSFRTTKPLKNDSVCWITYTNTKTHEILRKGFSQSPMFTGKIKGVGPRYCPSIEDKVERFFDKEKHQLFLEPEDLKKERIYVNGFSSSLPAKIQKEALQSIPGLEHCEILQYGYAVEYDVINANQLQVTYEVKNTPGLYFAGQVNGTSGYEEAAAQGIMAGINAHLKINQQDPFILSRAESYIGVLTDDLTSLDISEPYRMFTSQAEYRLFLRQDNAEERLLQKAYDIGMVQEETYQRYLLLSQKRKSFEAEMEKKTISLNIMNPFLTQKKQPLLKESVPMKKLLKRPEVSLSEVLELLNWKIDLPRTQLETIEAHILYAGFFERQLQEIEKFKKLANLKIPDHFDYEKAEGLSIEARQKMQELKPLTLYLAQKIAGVTPADISVLLYYLNTAQKNSTISS